MGGNALKNTVTERKSALEYNTLSKEVLEKLSTALPLDVFHVIQAYKNKPSFGDMDVLIVSKSTKDYNKVIVELFNPNEIVHNTNVWSFDYKKMQVDLIFTKEKDYEASTVYFAFNDLGNFMGRIAHKLGFKYGHDGLSYVFRSSTGDNVYAVYNFKRTPEEVFEFLGYNYNTFLNGFDELQDVFKYATTSKYFNKDIFHLDNRNAVSRVRDKKRKSYNEFLVWLESAQDLNAYPWESMKELGGRKNTVVGMSRAFEMFVEFRWWYHATELNERRDQEYKVLFNGDIVKEVTKLESKELGALMKYIKNQDSFTQDFVLKTLMTTENVQHFIECQFNEFKMMRLTES